MHVYFQSIHYHLIVNINVAKCAADRKWFFNVPLTNTDAFSSTTLERLVWGLMTFSGNIKNWSSWIAMWRLCNFESGERAQVQFKHRTRPLSRIKLPSLILNGNQFISLCHCSIKLSSRLGCGEAMGTIKFSYEHTLSTARSCEAVICWKAPVIPFNCLQLLIYG